jgi:hypothetical protein
VNRTKFYWALWMAGIGVTAFLLAFPITLRQDNVPHYSPDLFPNLGLFGVVLYTWAAIIAILLRWPVSPARWHGAGVILLVGLVQRAFWNFKIPVQGQAYVHVNAALAWQALGHVLRHPAGAYFDWPGVSLLYAALSDSTGRNGDWAAGALGVFISLVMALAAYVYFLAVLPTPGSATLSAVLAVVGNPASIMYLTAGPVAMVLVVMFLILAFRRDGLSRPAAVGVALILLTGISIIHFHSAMHIVAFSAALWTWQWLRGRRESVVPERSLQTLLLFTIPVAWLMLWGFGAFVWVAQAAWAFFSHPIDLWTKLSGVHTIEQSNFGEVVPEWYRLTRLAWLGLLYLPGGIIWLGAVRRWRSLAFPEGELAAIFAGLGVLSLASGFVSPRGFGELLRGLTYVPFFTVPLLILFYLRWPGKMATAATLILTVVTTVLTLPTFLANNHRAGILAPLRGEYAVGQWLSTMYGAGRGVHVFLTHPLLGPLQRSLLDASFTTDQEAESTGYVSQSRWEALDSLLEVFAASPRTTVATFFVHSPKIIIVSNMTYSIPVDDSRWSQMAARLTDRYDAVYVNGVVDVYAASQRTIPSANP